VLRSLTLSLTSKLTAFPPGPCILRRLKDYPILVPLTPHCWHFDKSYVQNYEVHDAALVGPLEAQKLAAGTWFKGAVGVSGGYE
jgi:hypothetical protein